MSESGFCKCGCGNMTNIIKHSDKRTNMVKGEYYDFIKGHARRNTKNSKEHNEAISKAGMNRIMPESQRLALSLFHLGRKDSDEVRKKKSEGCKRNGVGKWMKNRIRPRDCVEKQKLTRRENAIKNGYYHSDETKKKIGLRNAGENNGRFKAVVSLETRKLLSEASKDMWKQTEVRDKILNHPNRTDGSRRGAKRTYEILLERGFYNTKPEKKVKQILLNNDINFIHNHFVDNIEHKYYCDFYLPESKTIIEVDGVYWHRYPIGREIDAIRNKEIKDAGYNVIRVWEHEINEKMLIGMIAEISSIKIIVKGLEV